MTPQAAAPAAVTRPEIVRTDPAVQPALSAKPGPVPTPPLASSLAGQVDAWLQGGDPHRAMQAYEVISRCLLARRRAHSPDLPPDAPGENSASLCGDLRPDQILQRVSHLETAARAGEVGAALSFIQEGPSGTGLLHDLAFKDPSPPTADWLARRADYVERALLHCDLVLATYLGTAIRDSDKRGQAALRYWFDRVACPGKPAVNTTPLANDPEGLANLDALLINSWQQ